MLLLLLLLLLEIKQPIKERAALAGLIGNAVGLKKREQQLLRGGRGRGRGRGGDGVADLHIWWRASLIDGNDFGLMGFSVGVGM